MDLAEESAAPCRTRQCWIEACERTGPLPTLSRARRRPWLGQSVIDINGFAHSFRGEPWDLVARLRVCLGDMESTLVDLELREMLAEVLQWPATRRSCTP